MGEKQINPYALWLDSIHGIGSMTINKLRNYADCAEDIYHMSEEEIAACLTDAGGKPGDVKRRSSLIRAAQARDPMEEAERLQQRGIGFVSIEDSWFPEKILAIPDCPYGLFYIGKIPSGQRPCVAIIGSRNCSGYGREQARIFGERLALRGISVVSGMARGVDGIAGRAAANAGGQSFAVLGCGVDVVYPSENRELYDILTEKGGVISENPLGTQPKTTLFPRRNRLISGFADAVLVIEARRRSGTVITVDAALEQGKDIFALPGRVSDALSDGCNFLISQGAGIACSPDTIIEHFFGVSPEGTDMFEQQRLQRQRRREELSGLEAILFDALGCGDIMEADYLIGRAQSILGMHIDMGDFVSCMMSLQVRGLAVEIGSGHYKGIG